MEQKIDVMIDEAIVEARIAEIAQQLSKASISRER